VGERGKNAGEVDYWVGVIEGVSKSASGKIMRRVLRDVFQRGDEGKGDEVVNLMEIDCVYFGIM
jgi:hypothetical protein